MTPLERHTRDRFNAARDARQWERRSISARLEATMKPDPAFRRNRLAQFSPERVARYYRAVAGL
jgi:hypothetical protein